MIWFLVSLTLSTWDGHVKDVVPIGSFSNRESCDTERGKLPLLTASRFVCVNRLVEKK